MKLKQMEEQFEQTFDMTREQYGHMMDNVNDFSEKYQDKYSAGQKEHKGRMWDMGAYQALENMEDEVLDMWSYCRQVRKCLDEIREIVDDYNNDKVSPNTVVGRIEQIIERQKED